MSKRDFEAGYICAVANIVASHGDTIIARDVLAAQKPKDWSHINDYDYRILRDVGLAPKRRRASARRESSR